MNKINSIISYVVFFLGLIFVACEGVDPYGEDVANSLQLSVGQSDVNFDMEHSLPVSVNASDNFGWSATPSATWVRLSPSSGVGVGNISIDVEDNPSTEKRNAIVTLKSSRYNKTASFNVEQAGTYLRIDTTSISYFPLNGGKRNVPVVSNAAWEISSCPSWITTSVKSGSAGNSGFEMEVKENKGNSREGVVIVKNAALSYRINVTQGGVQLELGKQTMSFTNAKGSDTFTIKSNSSWTVTSNKPSWCTVDKSSGSDNATIKVSVTDNTSESSRDAIITVNAGDITKQVNVTQDGTQLKLSVDKLSYSPGSDSKTFTITSNGSWTVSSNKTSWCTVDKSSGSNNATIKVNVTANTSVSSRDAIITVKSGDITRKVNVTQEGVILNVGTDKLSFTPNSSSKTFTITSNGLWTVSSNKPSWCTVDKSSGSNNATIKVSVTDNTSVSSRDAIITIKSGDVTKQVKVTQDGIQLILSADNLSFTSSSGSKTFTITANYAWTVSSNKTSWCTVDKSSGSNNATIKVSVTDNTTLSSRDAIITIKSGDVTKQVKVTQAGIQPTLTVSTDKLSFTPGSNSKTFTITSNGSWTVSSNKTSWCTVDKSSGSNNATIKVSVTDNTSVSSRDAIITIKSGDLTRQVNVTQDGIQLKLSADNLSFTSSSGSKTFTITTNYASWTVSSDKTSWCTVDKSSGSATSATIKVTVTANTSDYSRSATITVKSGSATKTMSVSQSGKESQYVSYCDLKTDYPFAFTDGFVTGWSAGSNVAYCYIKVYKSWEISSLTDSQIITKLQSEVTREPVSEVKDYIRRFSGLYSSTNYVLCTYCLDKNNNHGNLVKYSFTTLSTTAPKAEITSVKYNNSYKEWYIYLTKRYNAYSYYLYCFEGIDNYNRHEHFTAYYARKSIAQGYGSVYYTWNPNYLTYNKSSNYVAFVSWARNSSYVFGNYDYFAGYSSSAPALMPAKREPTKTSGKECESMPRMDLPPYKPAKVVVVSPIE